MGWPFPPWGGGVRRGGRLRPPARMRIGNGTSHSAVPYKGGDWGGAMGTSPPTRIFDGFAFAGRCAVLRPAEQGGRMISAPTAVFDRPCRGGNLPPAGLSIPQSAALTAPFSVTPQKYEPQAMDFWLVERMRRAARSSQGSLFWGGTGGDTIPLFYW